MENASKALLMTGSILIGIILLSLAVYVYNIMSEAKKMETSTFTEEQLIKYNQEFLAYDKSVMYGTDVITVLSKAIDYNKRYAEIDESNFINIEFELLEGEEYDVKDVTTKYIYNNSTGRYTSSTLRGATVYFLNNKKYSLKKDKDNNVTTIEDFITNGIKTTTGKKEYINENDYQIKYSGFSDFKRMIFRCENVKYNKVGKVCYMKFKQTKASTYNTDN